MLADPDGVSAALDQPLSWSVGVMLDCWGGATGLAIGAASTAIANTPRPPDSAVASRCRSGGLLRGWGAIGSFIGTSSVDREC